jgi:RHS repeat-associated protein
VINYEYDPVGNVTNATGSLKVGLSTLDLPTLDFAYDAAERLSRVTSGPSTLDRQTFDHAYSPSNGLVSCITNLESGIVTSYAYDILDRATNVTYTASDGSLIQSINYAYDAASMITNKVQALGNGQEERVTYAFDSLDRLIGETTSSDGNSLFDIRYSYDLAGNRTSTVSVDGNADPVTNTYTLGTGNRLASWGSSGSALYDTAGNTTNLVSNNGTELDLEWDERYRLVNVDAASCRVAYDYDVLGRKVARYVVPPSGGSPTEEEHYIYDGNQIVADVDATGNLLRTYVWGKGIDNLLSFTDHASSITYYPIKDHQNTILALVDGNGAVVESYDYSAYGKVHSVKDGEGNLLTSESGLLASDLGNRYTFQGREVDWDTGLIYFRARWYNPETGRWLSKDPIRVAGGLNLYVYCANNPVCFNDPYGFVPTMNVFPSGATTDGITHDVFAGFVCPYPNPSAIVGGHGMPGSPEMAGKTDFPLKNYDANDVKECLDGLGYDGKGMIYLAVCQAGSNGLAKELSILYPDALVLGLNVDGNFEAVMDPSNPSSTVVNPRSDYSLYSNGRGIVPVGR